MRLPGRDEWGANAALPRKGHQIGASRRTEGVIHHTATVDGKGAPNEWESLEAVKLRMLPLQAACPDLGLDVPYNMVAFCMRDGELVVCEGRGLNRTGAHKRDRNRTALGIAFYGDFESGPTPRYFDRQLRALAKWLRTLRNDGGSRGLGILGPQTGRYGDTTRSSRCARFAPARLCRSACCKSVSSTRRTIPQWTDRASGSLPESYCSQQQPAF